MTRALRTLLVLAAVLSIGVARAPAARAADVAVSGVTLAWAVNGEQGSGAFFGGCNFLSAGTAPVAGSSRVWTQADGFYATQTGNVRIEKPNASGAYVQPTWATKCQEPNGATLSSALTTSLSLNRFVFSGGSGAVDLAANTARVSWSGSFTSVFYGGLTYWSAADPVLTINADGTGTLTATASGYGSSMDDPTKWVKLSPAAITLATLRNVSLSETGFTVTPDYLGVSIGVPAGATGQVARSGANQAYWGSFPQSFSDFQQLTGQASYWYTSGGARDPAKPTLPLTVAYTAPSQHGSQPRPSSAPSAGGGSSVQPSPPPAAAGSAGPSAQAGATVQLASDTVAPGGELRFSANGFDPGERVELAVRTGPAGLGSLLADPNGAVSGARLLPATLAAGPHELTLTGLRSQSIASAAFTVSGPGTAPGASAGATPAGVAAMAPPQIAFRPSSPPDLLARIASEAPVGLLLFLIATGVAGGVGGYLFTTRRRGDRRLTRKGWAARRHLPQQSKEVKPSENT